jgi:hypothetical protein
MTTTERRQSTRHPIDIKATIITPTASIPVTAMDICARGIRVLSPEPVPPETDIALSLDTREETLLSGSIIWTIEFKQEGAPPAFEVGIEADAFILKDQEAIGHTDRETFVQEILSRIQKSQV